MFDVLQVVVKEKKVKRWWRIEKRKLGSQTASPLGFERLSLCNMNGIVLRSFRLFFLALKLKARINYPFAAFTNADKPCNAIGSSFERFLQTLQ
jgi:hypothetical protein